MTFARDGVECEDDGEVGGPPGGGAPHRHRQEEGGGRQEAAAGDPAVQAAGRAHRHREEVRQGSGEGKADDVGWSLRCTLRGPCHYHLWGAELFNCLIMFKYV